MAFQSNIGGCPIIDDDNAHEFFDPKVDGERVCKGRMPRDFTREPLGSLGFAAPFKDKVKLIPRSDWDLLIKEKQERRERIKDMFDFHKMRVKNQGQTNYCWINAPVHAIELARTKANQEYVELSPASAGAMIKRGANVGGWGTEGVRWLAEHGPVPSSMWGNNQLSGWRELDAKYGAERAKYRVEDWIELTPRNFDQVASLLLYGIPVCVGLNWWGHEVTLWDLVKLDGTGRYGAYFGNSWGPSWGDNGQGVLTESKATQDDGVSPIVVVGGDVKKLLTPSLSL
jgi:hypothetical protein